MVQVPHVPTSAQNPDQRLDDLGYRTVNDSFLRDVELVGQNPPQSKPVCDLTPGNQQTVMGGEPHVLPI